MGRANPPSYPSTFLGRNEEGEERQANSLRGALFPSEGGHVKPCLALSPPPSVTPEGHAEANNRTRVSRLQGPGLGGWNQGRKGGTSPGGEVLSQAQRAYMAQRLPTPGSSL